MTLSIQSRSESAPATGSFRVSAEGYAGAGAEPSICEIVPISMYRQDDAVPQGWLSVSDLAKKFEKIPERQALLAAARQKLSRLEEKASRGHTLRSFRMSKGLSQQQFAEMLGSSQTYIARLETSAASSAGLDFMRRFCAAFGVDMNSANEIFR